MKTTSRLLYQKVKRYLKKNYSVEEIGSITYLILEDIFGLERKGILLNQNITTTDSQEKELSDMIIRLQKHEPIQYILGSTEFYGRRFSLDPSVLIPRPETEELVQMVIKENQTPSPKVLDIGTGSGCIAVTLQLELAAQVIACDTATEALTMATRNASSLGAKVKFLTCDILQQQPEIPPLDIIVSNPPYVTEGEKHQMDANVLDYEPPHALFVSDQDPLVFYTRIADLSRDLLKPGGKLYFEINERFGGKIKDLLHNFGYRHIEVNKDLHGKDRFAKAVWG